jgi:DNA-binding beta-propeller fold protein YncE
VKRKVLYALAVFCAVSCTKDVGHISKGGFPHEVDRIITGSCAVAGCHTSQSSEVAGGINLETWEKMFEGSDNGSPVIPYSTKFSSLLYFINTYPDLGLTNTPTMPLNSSPLSREQVQTIKTWIGNGAPDVNGKIKWSDDAERKKLYAANQGCDVVSVIDAATGLPMRMIDVGFSSSSDAPHQVRVSPDGKFWYVIFINSNFMQKFRCSDDSYVGDIPLTPYAAGLSANPDEDAVNWNSFIISPDGKRAYCVSLDPSGKIAAVDLENRRFIRWIGGQHYPHGVALNKAADKIYVTANTGNFITEFDTAFSQSEDIVLEGQKNLSSSLDLHDIILSQGGNELLVTCEATNEVRVVDLNTRTVKNIVHTGVFPQEIVYSKKTGDYFVTCTNDTTSFPGARGVVTRISSSYNSTSIKCGVQPHGLAVNETTNTLYVLSRNLSSKGIPPHHSSVCSGRNGFVTFIDLSTFTVKPGTFELSVDPYFIFAR